MSYPQYILTLTVNIPTKPSLGDVVAVLQYLCDEGYTDGFFKVSHGVGSQYTIRFERDAGNDVDIIRNRFCSDIHPGCRPDQLACRQLGDEIAVAMEDMVELNDIEQALYGACQAVQWAGPDCVLPEFLDDLLVVPYAA